MSDTEPDTSPDADDDRTSGRRAALRLLGAAAAGAVASAVVADGHADAGNGDPLTLGSVFNSATAPTGTAMVTADKQNYGFGVTDNGLTIPTPSPGPQNAAILGHAAGTAFDVAVGAFAVGFGTRALEASAVGTAATGLVVRFEGDSSAAIRAQGDSTSEAISGSNFGFGNGVSGYSQFGTGISGDSANGAGVLGRGGTGGLFFGGQANVRLVPIDDDPLTATGVQPVGRLAVDANGNLWVSVTTGSPATWRKIAGPGTAGAFHAITPTRVYDSREALPGPPAPVAGGAPRTVSVKDGRAVGGGAVTVANLVPTGATAVAVNVGIVTVTGPGFLAVNPGGNTTVTASSINWTAAGQIVANGIIATISPSREVTLIAGGGGSTHVFLDVTGYFR